MHASSNKMEILNKTQYTMIEFALNKKQEHISEDKE